MASHNDLGAKGESMAVSFLRNNNYAIIETNWRWRKAEVDIIAQINNTLVFIEVKTRSYDNIIKPEEAVSLKKQQMLKDAAEAYCENNLLEVELRFDIIAIIKQGQKSIIKHIIQAY